MCAYVWETDAAVSVFFRASEPDVLPAVLAQWQRLSVGGANAAFSPSSICGLPMRQSSAHPPTILASLLLLHTLMQSFCQGC